MKSLLWDFACNITSIVIECDLSAETKEIDFTNRLGWPEIQRWLPAYVGVPTHFSFLKPSVVAYPND
jgi:hypothetical protein